MKKSPRPEEVPLPRNWLVMNATLDVPAPTTYLLLSRGSDTNSFAIANANQRPAAICMGNVGPVTDVPVGLLGRGHTKVARGSAAIPQDATVTNDDGGLVRSLPKKPGTYWVVGQALTACKGRRKLFVLNDCHPYQITVK